MTSHHAAPVVRDHTPFELISEIIHLQVLVRHSVTVTGKLIYSIRQRSLSQFTDENTEAWGIPVVVRFAKWQSCETQRVVLPLLSPLTHCENKEAERQRRRYRCQCPFSQEEPPSWLLGKFFHHSLQPRVLLACPRGYHVPNSMPDARLQSQTLVSITLSSTTLTVTGSGRYLFF